MSYYTTGSCVTAHVHKIINFLICDSSGFKRLRHRLSDKIEAVINVQRGFVALVPEFWRTRIKEEVWSIQFFFFFFQLYSLQIISRLQPLACAAGHGWHLSAATHCPIPATAGLFHHFLLDSIWCWTLPGSNAINPYGYPVINMDTFHSLALLIPLFSSHMHLPACIYPIHFCNHNLRNHQNIKIGHEYVEIKKMAF